MTDTWISVEPTNANVAHLETVRGIQVQVFASPHNVPIAVKGEFDKPRKRFVIVLRYVDQDESSLIQELSDDGFVHVFKGSLGGRVERIEVDINKNTPSSISLNIQIPQSSLLIDRVEQRLSHLSTLQNSIAARLNYLAVTEAIEQSKGMLIAS